MWLSCYSAWPASRRPWVHTQALHKTRSEVSYLGPELGMQRHENQKFVVLELEASLEYTGPCLKLRPAWVITRPCLKRKKKKIHVFNFIPS